MTGVTPLAAFSDTWIGGDIYGLQAVAERLFRYVPRVQDLTGRLSVVARDLTDDGPDGWQGAAASAFLGAWGRQVKMAAALEDFVVAVAVVVDRLAVELSQIENALEDQAYEASKHGVRVGADGTITGYSGVHGLEWATAYTRVWEQAKAGADAARDAAARELNGLVQQVANANPHPSPGDAITMSGLLADLLASPTAARREVTAELKALTGQSLRLDQEFFEAKRAGGSGKGIEDESDKVRDELNEVKGELGRTGRLESELSKLLDTRVSNVQDLLQGKGGAGRHAAGNTPKDLQAAAEREPGTIERILGFGEEIPVVDVGATALGTAVGAYYDVKGGQVPGAAIGDELVSNTTGMVAGSASAGLAGVQIGTRLGALGGPVGIAVGAVVGYGVGDLTHNLLTENWSADIHDHGVIGGVWDGAGHSVDQTVDDGREMGVGVGHDVEHAWDSVFG